MFEYIKYVISYLCTHVIQKIVTSLVRTTEIKCISHLCSLRTVLRYVTLRYVTLRYVTLRHVRA